MDKKRPTLRTLLRNRSGAAALLAAGLAMLAGCAKASPSLPPEDSLPAADSIAGWKPAGEPSTFTRQTLFDYINGASEYYFTYTFETVAAARYANGAGTELIVEVWRFAESEDAYGLFSGRAGVPAASVGQARDAVLESGVRLVFWQNRYYANLAAVDTVADDDLLRFAEFISQALPAGGEKPAILQRLPADGLVAGSEKFFHMELAVQERIWLGGENLLGLGTDTDAVAARYRLGGAECQLLLVEYPDTARADAAVRALDNGAAQDLAGRGANGPLLAAVFGRDGGAEFEVLLAKALGKSAGIP